MFTVLYVCDFRGEYLEYDVYLVHWLGTAAASTGREIAEEARMSIVPAILRTRDVRWKLALNKSRHKPRER